MIEPRVLKGFKDTLPENMINKKNIIYKLESVFESYGFVPIDTPALEYTEILLGKGGGETDKQIYRFRDHGDRDVALRYDLTVPLARFVSEHFNELTFPFKRYHIAPVWRGENTQKGRYREFYQCDFDILGSSSINADIDILLTIKNGFDAISAGDYVVNINHRKVLNGFLEKLGVKDKAADILRTVDKIYKIGVDNVVKELVETHKIEPAITDSIIKFLNIVKAGKGLGITGEEIFNVINDIRNMVGEDTLKYVDELETVFKTISECGYLDRFSYNPAITRGLDYYTGIVFESFIKDAVEFGSVCSGGRYDNLTGLYSKNEVVGVGASFGLDRLLALMESKNLLSKKSAKTEILIFNMDNKFYPKYQKIASDLRKENINVEVFLDNKKIPQQFKYAEKKTIKYVLFAGESEIINDRYSLKNIIDGVEKKDLSIRDVIKELKG